MLRREVFLVILGLLVSCILIGCLKSEAKITDIKYVFYTIGIEPDPIVQPELIQGKELKEWANTGLAIQPNVFDIVIALKNENSIATKPSKLRVEFWLSEAEEILDEGNHGLDLDKMKASAKWFKMWEKEIDLPEIKANQQEEIKVERINIEDLDQSEYDQKKLILMGWKCLAIYGESKFEKIFTKTFLD